MPSLSSLLADHGPLLILDAASLRVQVGLLRPAHTPRWRVATDDAGAGVFSATASLLAEAQLPLAGIGAFVYCEGPGSMLGVRTVAMALRTWQTLKPRPAYAYQSLTVAAHFARAQHHCTEFIVIADARREAWHCVRVTSDGSVGQLQHVPTTELPANLPWLTPEQFRSWSQAPRPLQTTGYDLQKILDAHPEGDFFQIVATPGVFQATPPEYKKWSAQIHQSPVIVP